MEFFKAHILFLPESISSSLNYSLDSSSPTTIPSSSSNSHSFEDENEDDSILEEGGSAESYSSGAAGGYKFTKPFNIHYNAGDEDVMSYIGSDGYLYTGGYAWGTTSNGNTPWYKQTNAGTNIVDHEISNSYGMIVNSTGQVKVAPKTAGSATWSTVSVGGSATGSSNKAVAVSIGSSYQMVLMEDGKLYVATDGATSMTSTVSFDNSSTGGIVDIAMGYSFQYVLFGNGDLYGSSHGASSMTRIATGVKMFDYTCGISFERIYIYDGNMIKTATAKGAGTHTWSNLLSSNRTDVVQIRGTSYSLRGGGWGFLTSSGTLYTCDSYSGTSMTNCGTGISYFDMGGEVSVGYLKDGQIYIWNLSASGKLTSSSSPSLQPNMSNNSGLPTPDLGGIPALTPPAKQKKAQLSRFFVL